MTPPSVFLDSLSGGDSRIITCRFHRFLPGSVPLDETHPGPRLRLKIQTLNHHQIVIRTGQLPLGCGFRESSVQKIEANCSPNASLTVKKPTKVRSQKSRRRGKGLEPALRPAA